MHYLSSSNSYFIESKVSFSLYRLPYKIKRFFMYNIIIRISGAGAGMFVGAELRVQHARRPSVYIILRQGIHPCPCLSGCPPRCVRPVVPLSRVRQLLRAVREVLVLASRAWVAKDGSRQVGGGGGGGVVHTWWSSKVATQPTTYNVQPPPALWKVGSLDGPFCRHRAIN